MFKTFQRTYTERGHYSITDRMWRSGRIQGVTSLKRAFQLRRKIVGLERPFQWASNHSVLDELHFWLFRLCTSDSICYSGREHKLTHSSSREQAGQNKELFFRTTQRPVTGYSYLTTRNSLGGPKEKWQETSLERRNVLISLFCLCRAITILNRAPTNWDWELQDSNRI